MWMIGAVSEDQVKKLEKMGFEIERMVKPDEFNKMADPNSKFNESARPKDNGRAGDLALIYFDVNLFAYLIEKACIA